MAEPTTTTGLSLTALAVAVAGPVFGPYSAILFAALAGSLWPLSAAEDLSRASGAWLLLRCVLTSVVLTGAIAAAVATHYDLAATELLSPVAFFIGALGNGWRPVFGAVAGALAAIASRFGTVKEKP